MITSLVSLEFAQALIPIDCTPSSAEALEKAIHLFAPLTGSRLTLLVSYAPVPRTLAGDDTERFNALRRRHAEEALEKAAARLRSFGIPLRRVVRQADDMAEAVLAEARGAFPYDFVVLGSHLARPDRDRPCAPTFADRILSGVRQVTLVLPGTAVTEPEAE